MRVKYAFIDAQRDRFPVQRLCQVLGVARSGFYQWIHEPLSPRAIENERLLGLIRESYVASGRVYGSPRIFLDLREAGEYIGHNLCKAHKLDPSMSRRGNCWDNAVAESFFSSLKKKRIRRQVYRTRDLEKADVFEYIEMFYNRTRRHSHIGGVSPEVFESASNRSL